jgi:hypothetical protein
MPIFEVERMDVSGGRRHYVKRGMAYGFLIGAGIGVLVRTVAATNTDSYIRTDPRANPSILAVAAASGTAFGAIAGAMGTELWQSTPIRQGGSRVGLIAPPGPARLTIALTAKF